MDAKLKKAIAFFKEHGGGVVGERALGALAVWVPDREQLRSTTWEGIKKAGGVVIASLSGIADPDMNYRRVVEAELALEGMEVVAAEAEKEHLKKMSPEERRFHEVAKETFRQISKETEGAGVPEETRERFRRLELNPQGDDEARRRALAALKRKHPTLYSMHLARRSGEAREFEGRVGYAQGPRVKAVVHDDGKVKANPLDVIYVWGWRPTSGRWERIIDTSPEDANRVLNEYEAEGGEYAAYQVSRIQPEGRPEEFSGTAARDRARMRAAFDRMHDRMKKNPESALEFTKDSKRYAVTEKSKEPDVKYRGDPVWVTLLDEEGYAGKDGHIATTEWLDRNNYRSTGRRLSRAKEARERWIPMYPYRDNPAPALPAAARNAIDKYLEFHDKDPKRLVAMHEVKPSHLFLEGRARTTYYRSNKWGQKASYFHDHDEGVRVASIDHRGGGREVPVPAAVRECKALVELGDWLGTDLVAHDGEEVSAKPSRGGAKLCCVPSGKVLVVVEGRTITMVIWGGRLDVRDVGIVH